MYAFLRLRSLLLTGLLGLLVVSVTAQSRPPGRRFGMGLKIGANFSQLSELSFQTPRLGTDGLPVLSGGQVVYDFFQQNDSRSQGLVGGLFVRFGDRVFIQPELLFSMKGGSFTVLREGLENGRADVRFGTLDLPLLVGVRLGPLRLNAGPVASLPLSDDQNLRQAMQPYWSQPLRETARQAVFGYQAGVGLKLGGLLLDVRRESSLSELTRLIGSSPAPTTGSASGPATPRIAGKTALWQLTVGFGF
jgi:hypothetical protein